MNILVVHPQNGGIDVYALSLAAALRCLGATVTTACCSLDAQPYDKVTHCWRLTSIVKESIVNWASEVEFLLYDLVVFNFGKNDPEQYVPIALNRLGIKLRHAVYMVHYLSWNLFDRFLDDPIAAEEVRDSLLSFFDGYVFFGSFAQHALLSQLPREKPNIVSFLPCTHPQNIAASARTALSLLNRFSSMPSPCVVLPGYAANYKDTVLLTCALGKVEEGIDFVLFGAGWKKRLGHDFVQCGKSRLWIYDQETSPQDFFQLCSASDFGVFPYRQPDDMAEVFQGSGTLPNFLSLGKASLVLDEGCMAEYIGDGGIVVTNRCPKTFAEGISFLIKKESRQRYEEYALRRSRMFSMAFHAQSCFQFFSHLLLNR